MGDSVRNFTNKFRIRRLEANATTNIDSQKYREALAVLAELKKLQSNENVVSRVHTMVMESLCHLRLSEDSAASEVNQKIVKIVTSSIVTPGDITEMAEVFTEEGKHTRAYILYYAACKLSLVQDTIHAATKIQSVTFGMQTMAKEMVKLIADKIVVARHMIPAMKKIVEELVAMPDNDSNEKLNNEAWCYSYIAWCYCYLGDTDQELAMYEAGINIMKEKFGNDAEKYRITGLCYNNAGLAYSELGQEDKAISAYKSAIRVKEKATDYTNEQEKDKDIAFSLKNLSIVEK